MQGMPAKKAKVRLRSGIRELEFDDLFGPLVTELRSQLQAALGAAFTIERELGGGGMSRVFVAEDTGLGRQVVVKVLPRELAGGVSTARFHREVALAARLQHPTSFP